MTDIKIEIIADSVKSALAAQRGGADRIELCDNLCRGGTTPSTGMIETVRKSIDIKIFTMIRPRGGDFLYSDDEIRIMKRDIEIVKSLGVDGTVLGILKPDGTVDVDRSGELVEIARPLEVTFHRAFDMTSSPLQALEDIIGIGFERVLTSGQQPTALKGKKLIKQLNETAGDRISVMAGSGINEQNINAIIEYTGVRECHFSASKILYSRMEYKKYLNLGSKKDLGEFENTVADENRITTIRDIIK